MRYCIYQVFVFGSVPLKTYLPDGDIDLTVLTPQAKEEDFAKALCSMLKAEDGETDFQITGVQYITAQVLLGSFFVLNYVFQESLFSCFYCIPLN